MAKTISIIVPVYNTEAYLNRCVQSVLCQTYQSFELLLIDDGSQDGSGAMCRTLCGEDSRIRFLPMPHRGVSAARNAGIEAAEGDYIFFLDSDDTIHPHLLEALLELCQATGAALATEVYRHVEAVEPHDFLESPGEEDGRRWEYTYMDNQEALRQFSSRDNGYNFHGIGGKLVRRNAMGELRFDEALGNGEDTIFVYKLLERGLDAVILWEEWYAYRKHGNNSSQNMSVASCSDSRKCWIYIWERERSRPAAAAFWAQVASAQLRRLYVRSRQSRCDELSAYLRQLAREETHKERFRLLSRPEQWKHYLAFWCYPLYLPMHRFSTWQWQRREREQEQRRKDRGWNG